MMRHKFYIKQPQDRTEKDKTVDLSDDRTDLFISMGNVIATDKPLFFTVDIDENYKGSISAFYLFDKEKKLKLNSIEYGPASGRLFQMAFSSKEDFDKNREKLKILNRQFNDEDTLSMRKRNNSSLAKRVVEKIAEYVDSILQNPPPKKELLCKK